MAITYQTIAGITTVASGTLNLTEPAGSTTDDLLVACVSFRGNATPSIPTGWNIVIRTNVAGNTATNNTAIGSGLMAYIKRGATAPALNFGATTAFPNQAIGTIIRISGQDLTDPLAGASVNTLATGASGTVTTGAFTRSFATETPGDYLEVMACIGGQEVTWSTQQYTTGATNFTERSDNLSVIGADGSLSVATGTGGNITGGYRATTSAISARHSLIVASFGGPRPTAVGYSFSTLF
jgi:hypothetical protein